MTTYEVLDALVLIARAPAEATRHAHDTYNKMPIDVKIPIMSRARGHVFNSFGNPGLNVVTFDCARAARAASEIAGYRDHYDHRAVEIATEIMAEALMAKPYLKPEEFALLMSPWGPYLGEEWTGVEGAGTEKPPPVVQAVRNETATQKKVRQREARRDAAKETKIAQREERTRIRDEKAREKSKAKAEKPVARAHVAAAPIDLEAAILGMNGPIEVHAMPIKAPRLVSEHGVRIFWAKRLAKWILLVPPPSMAMITKEKFDTQEAAREFADANGWPVLGVMIPKEGGPNE